MQTSSFHVDDHTNVKLHPIRDHCDGSANGCNSFKFFIVNGFIPGYLLRLRLCYWVWSKFSFWERSNYWNIRISYVHNWISEFRLILPQLFLDSVTPHLPNLYTSLILAIFVPVLLPCHASVFHWLLRNSLSWCVRSIIIYLKLCCEYLTIYIHLYTYMIIRVFCPKAGPSLQAEEPRLQFCRRQVFHQKLRNQGFSFTRDSTGAVASRCFPHPTLSLVSEQTLEDLKRSQGHQRGGEENRFG